MDLAVLWGDFLPEKICLFLSALYFGKDTLSLLRLCKKEKENKIKPTSLSLAHTKLEGVISFH